MRKVIFSCLLLLGFVSFSQVNTAVEVQDTLSNDLVPANLLFKKPDNSFFRLSPNGKYFAEIVETNDEKDLVIIDINAYALYKRIPLSRIFIQNLYWLNNDMLAYETLGEIYTIGKDGNDKKLLVSAIYNDKPINYNRLEKSLRFNHIENMLANDPDHILIETLNHTGYSDLYKVNLFTGEQELVREGKKDKVNKWYTSGNGEVALIMRFDKDETAKYLQFNTDINDYEFIALNYDGRFYELGYNGKSIMSKNADLLAMGHKPNEVYITSTINSDKRNLLAYNIKERIVTDTLVSDPNYDVGDYQGDDLDLIYDYKNDRLAGVYYEAVSGNYRWFADDFSMAHRLLNSQYKNFKNHILDSDVENNRFLVHQSNNNSGGNIGVFNLRDSTYSIMLSLNHELDAYKLSKTMPMVIKTRDSTQILGYLNKPIKETDSTRALVVIPHGGPWARDYDNLDGFSQYFATRGFYVLRVNFRGSTGFGRKHLLDGVSGLHSVMIDDITDGVRQTIARQNIDPGKVFIFGHSYGGYATYMSLMRYPDMYKAGVALSAPTDLKSWMRWQKKEDVDFSYDFWEQALGNKDKDYLKMISPIYNVEKLQDPLLIFHGKYDDVIPIEQAKEMAEVLKEQNKVYDLEILQTLGHSLRNSFSMEYILRKSEEFFKEQL